MNKVMLMCKVAKLGNQIWKMLQEKWPKMPVVQLVCVEVWRETL